MSEVTVSVIVAAYRAEATLKRALRSLREQTRADWEAIVVDDASPDGTAALAEDVAREEPRVRVLRLPHNGGPGVARNAGLAAARGRWIAMLDADDAFTPDRLERLVAFAEAEKLDMAADDLMLIAPGAPPSALLGERVPPTGLDIDTAGFISGNRGARGQGRVLLGFLKPLVRRDFLLAHDLRYREMRLAEDYFLYLEALLAGARWRVAGFAGYLYAVRPDSLTATFTPRQLDAMAEADRSVLRRLDARARPVEAAAIRRHHADVRTAAAWTRLVEALRARAPLAATRAFVKAPAAWPGLLGKALEALPRVLGAGRRRTI